MEAVVGAPACAGVGVVKPQSGRRIVVTFLLQDTGVEADLEDQFA